MEDKVYNLPDDFYPGKPSDAGIVFYETDKSSRNNKVTFKQNMICFIQAGEKQISGRTLCERFDSKDLYLLSRGNVLMTENTTAEHGYSSILLFFSNKYLLEFLHRNPASIKSSAKSSSCVKISKDDYFLNLEQSLLLLKPQLNSNPVLLKVKVDEILLYLLHNHADKVADVIHTMISEDRNASLTEVVLANLENNLTVEELAFLCSMSVSSFKRKFAEVYATTPKQYFIEHKMRRAVALLRESKRPTEIYSTLGYEELSSFGNEFKKHYGKSPMQYLQDLD